MPDETIPSADDAERPATQDEMPAMLEELRELWWQVETDRRRIRAAEITHLETLLPLVDEAESAEIQASLAELRSEQAVAPQLPF